MGTLLLLAGLAPAAATQLAAETGALAPPPLPAAPWHAIRLEPDAVGASEQTSVDLVVERLDPPGAPASPASLAYDRVSLAVPDGFDAGVAAVQVGGADYLPFEGAGCGAFTIADWVAFNSPPASRRYRACHGPDGELTVTLSGLALADTANEGAALLSLLLQAPGRAGAYPFLATLSTSLGGLDEVDAFAALPLELPSEGPLAATLFVLARGDGWAGIADVRLGVAAGLPYGAQLGVGAPDAVHLLASPSPFADTCFTDDDGSGAYEAGEPVYATQGGCGAEAGLAGNDLRLTPAAGQPAGSQVRAAHADFGNPTVAFPGGSAVGFFDADGDAAYSLGDAVYLDISGDGGALGTVGVGDVRITPWSSFAAGSVVAPGGSDVNNALAAPQALAVSAWTWLDADGDGSWTGGDAATIDADASGTTTVGDVRLGDAAGPYGSQAAPGDGDLVYVLAGPFPFTALCFVDDDGSGTYQAGEGVYAVQQGCGADVAGNDLRLTQVAGQPAGTQARATHSDFGNPTSDFPGGSAVTFFDADGDASYSEGDAVYADLGGDGGDALGTVTVGDVRITPFGALSAGSAVAAGDADINNALVAPGAFAIGAWDTFDADGDGLWTRGDVAYLDAGGDGLATAQDVRLGAIGGHDYGSAVRFGDDDLVARLGASPFVAMCYVDDDDSGSHDPGEAVYATQLACGDEAGVTGNDVRLTPAGGEPAGTQVRAIHNDFGEPTVELGGVVDFRDDDGDGGFAAGDPVYVDADADGVVTAGDVRLVPTGAFAAGSVVEEGDADERSALCGAACALPAGFGPGSSAVQGWAFLDADGDTRWTRGDLAYLDAR